MNIKKSELEQIIKEEIEQVTSENASLKIPVERYDAFKRKIEQWAMLYGKFTRYTADLDHQSFDRKTHGRRLRRAAIKLEQELRKILQEFDMEYKDYGEERYAMRQKLDQFDGDSEFFMNTSMKSVDEVAERKLSEPEKKEKEKVVKGMKKNKKDFKKRYGDDAESVMYATATKIAKEKK